MSFFNSSLMCCIVRCPKICLYPSPERLTLLTFISVKLLYDIGTGQDVWHAARVFWVFPPPLDHLLEINHPDLNLSCYIIIFALKIAVYSPRMPHSFVLGKY